MCEPRQCEELWAEHNRPRRCFNDYETRDELTKKVDAYLLGRRFRRRFISRDSSGIFARSFCRRAKQMAFERNAASLCPKSSATSKPETCFSLPAILYRAHRTRPILGSSSKTLKESLRAPKTLPFPVHR